MKGGRALEQNVWGTCGISLSGDTQSHLEMFLCHLAGGWTGYIQRSFPTLTLILGRHSLQAGYMGSSHSLLHYFIVFAV